MNKTFGLVWKSKITLPLVIAAVASISFLTISHYKIGQTASVNAASCYFQSEVDKSNQDKQALTDKLTETNNEIQQVSADLVSNSNAISDTQSKIDEITKTLVSDFVMGQKKVLVDNAYAELNDRKAIDDLVTGYTAKTNDVNKQVTATNALTASINNTYSLLQKITSQLGAKKSLESQTTSVATAKSNFDSLQQQIIDMQKIEAAQNSGSATYSTLLSSYKNKYKNYVTPVLLDSTSLKSKSLGLKNSYYVANSGLIRSTTVYRLTYKNDVRTSTELTAYYNTIAKQYADLKQQYTDMTGQIVKIRSDIATIKTQVTTAANNYQKKYNYDSSIPTIATVQKQYDTVSAAYKDMQSKNADINTQINDLKNTLATLNAKTTELNDRGASLNGTAQSLSGQISDLETLITNEQNNICPTTETSCSDGIDNDRDGVQDCDDSDCSTDPSCMNTNTNLITTDTTSLNTTTNVNLNTGTDSNTNTTDTNVTPTNETNCADGIDNDHNGQTDCADSYCSADPACSSLSIGTDANNTNIDNGNGNQSESDCGDGVDNDGNGFTDCSDPACSTASICSCQIKDIDGNVLGTCADFGVTSESEITNNQTNGANGSLGSTGGTGGLVKSPSQCPIGTKAVAVGQFKGTDGVAVNYYRCVTDTDNTEKSECGNGKVDPGEECEEGESVSHGSCVSCSISCDPGWTRQLKEDWVPQIPILGGLIRKAIPDKWYCSQLKGLNDKGLNEIE